MAGRGHLGAAKLLLGHAGVPGADGCMTASMSRAIGRTVADRLCSDQNRKGLVIFWLFMCKHSIYLQLDGATMMMCKSRKLLDLETCRFPVVWFISKFQTT